MKLNNTQQTAFAVCQFYKSGAVFPVEIDIHGESDAARKVQWMKIGAGQNEDWRAITMKELAGMKDKICLDCFTELASAEKLKIISKYN